MTNTRETQNLPSTFQCCTPLSIGDVRPVPLPSSGFCSQLPILRLPENQPVCSQGWFEAPVCCLRPALPSLQTCLWLLSGLRHPARSPLSVQTPRHPSSDLPPPWPLASVPPVLGALRCDSSPMAVPTSSPQVTEPGAEGALRAHMALPAQPGHPGAVGSPPALPFFPDGKRKINFLQPNRIITNTN